MEHRASVQSERITAEDPGGGSRNASNTAKAGVKNLCEARQLRITRMSAHGIPATGYPPWDIRCWSHRVRESDRLTHERVRWLCQIYSRSSIGLSTVSYAAAMTQGVTA